MTAGDDNDDDAQLRQLRAVWVSMRDEDPPDRGLAALMAAAREKAAELEQAARPSWWQRVLATLRRPPVLALATVTLLFGGAVLVAQRASSMKADSVAETEDKHLADGYGDLPKGGESHAGPSVETTTAVAPGASAGSAATVAPELAKPSEVPVEKPRPRDARSVPKATKPATNAPTAAKPPTDDVLGRKEKVTSSESGATLEMGPRGGAGGAPPAMAIAQDPDPVVTDNAPRDEQAKAKPKKPIARTAPPSIEGEDRQVSKDTAKQVQPTLEQLVKQCETAAARGDCAAVRVIAQKILTTAPTAYKSRVAQNASINRCLPSAASNAASD